jgi:carbon-monoxide dehydrogenase large subunit
MTNPTGIGASIKRKEDLRFLTGNGNYVSDIKRPNMAMGVFLRSPHAHAKIKSIDVRPALAMPGVVAVLTGEDLKADGIGGLPCAWPVTGKNGAATKEPAHPALAQGKVRCVGDAVAFVVADTLEQARSAAEAVEVDYEVLPTVVGMLDAIKPGAPAVFDDIPDNVCVD